MSDTFWKTLRRSSLLLGGLFLIFQSFRVLKSFVNPGTAAISKVISKTNYRQLLPYIIAQAKHETGSYTSENYIAFHNLFGMKNAYYRTQLGISMPNSDYRYYASDDESVRDFVIYLDFVGFPTWVPNAETYVKELKQRNYFEAPFTEYLGGVQRYVS